MNAIFCNHLCLNAFCISTPIFLDYISCVMGILSVIITGITAYIALAAFQYTKKEFSLYQEKEKSEILSAFNERYSTDCNIKAVVTYLNKIDEFPISEPSTFQKEMFLRFFEELQYAIEKKVISEELVYDMFAYYALKAYDIKFKFYNEEDEINWLRFNAFIRCMNKYKVKKSYYKQ